MYKKLRYMQIKISWINININIYSKVNCSRQNMLETKKKQLKRLKKKEERQRLRKKKFVTCKKHRRCRAGLKKDGLWKVLSVGGRVYVEKFK